MCHINIFIKKNKQPIANDNNLLNCINVCSYGSFVLNSDGEGFLAQNKEKQMFFDKSEEKLFFSDVLLRDSHILVTHERLSTSGLNNNMTHPHIFENITLLHNGVFSGIGDSLTSDTFIYAQKINDCWNAKKPYKSISKTNKNVSGSFSCVLRDNTNGKLYYYKNASTSFFIVSDDDYLIASSSKDNADYCKNILAINSTIKEVKCLTLFDIENDFKAIATICNTKNVYVTSYNNDNGYYSGYSSKNRDWSSYGWSDSNKVGESELSSASFEEIFEKQKKKEKEEELRDYDDYIQQRIDNFGGY